MKSIESRRKARGSMFLVPLLACLIAPPAPLSGQADQHPTAAERQAALQRLEELEAMPPVKGVVFHLCSCGMPCPCLFSTKDVEGCVIVRVYRIIDGGYMGKQLAGLTSVVVPHPEKMQRKAGAVKQGGKAVDEAIYIPAGLPEATENGLIGTIAEQSMSLGWNNVVRHRAAITYKPLADGYEIGIPGVFHAITHSRGLEGKPIVVDNLENQDGSRWTFGKTSVHTYRDPNEPEWNWKMPNTNGSWSNFVWGPHIDPSDELLAGRKYRGYVPPAGSKAGAK